MRKYTYENVVEMATPLYESLPAETQRSLLELMATDKVRERENRQFTDAELAEINDLGFQIALIQVIRNGISEIVQLIQGNKPDSKE